MSVPDADPQQLIKRIGRALLGAAPADWKQIRAEYRSAGRHIEADVLITGDDDQQHPIRPPQDVVELLGELRALMYRPGRGTWLSGLYVLDHPSKYSAEFEPDTEPRWRRVPPPIGFQDELRRFPREDAHIPEWLRARAGLPPIPDTTATPPGGIPAPAGSPPSGAATPPPSGPPPQHSGPHPQAGHPSGHPGTPPGGFPPPQRHTPPGGFPAPGHTPPGGMPRPPGPRPSPEGALPAGPVSGPPGGAPAPNTH
jgi:hypothetical protein